MWPSLNLVIDRCQAGKAMVNLSSMRLKESQVKLLCQKLLSGLRSKQLIALKKSDPDVLNRMQEIFIKELKLEDDINLQAERILAENLRKLGVKGDQIDREKMFEMIKKQLLKEKNVIV
jgi:hypothetical protein